MLQRIEGFREVRKDEPLQAEGIEGPRRTSLFQNCGSDGDGVHRGKPQSEKEKVVVQE